MQKTYSRTCICGVWGWTVRPRSSNLFPDIGEPERLGRYRWGIAIFSLNLLLRSCSCRRTCVHMRSIATLLLCPGTIFRKQGNQPWTKRLFSTYNVSMGCSRTDKVVIWWLNKAQISANCDGDDGVNGEQGHTDQEFHPLFGHAARHLA